MDKIKAFKNASEFQELFGIQEHGNGVKSRRNKILLQFYKSKTVWDYCKGEESGGRFERLFSIRNMADLKERVIAEILDDLRFKANFGRKRMYQVILIDKVFFSSVYSTDGSYGIPSNGDVGSVRYITHEEKREGKAYRMRAGRFYKRLLLESDLGKALPEQVLNWLCEQFAESWSSYIVRRLPHFTLHVDENFERIYSYGSIDEETYGCTHDFNSCMMGDGQWRFYKECVKAKAAYLTNDDNEVIARCVIFTEVYDEDGKIWRLAERQYAEEGLDLFKRCLVDSLVDAGEIDGYKQVGADCHSTTSYVDKDGNSLMDKKFKIKCNLEFSKHAREALQSDSNRILSYQDSFKFFDYMKREAYNTEPCDLRFVTYLDTTNCYLEGCWDEYHEQWCVNFVWVYVQGREICCDSNRLEDFIDFRGVYVHKDEFTKCPVCGREMPDPKFYDGYSFMYKHNESDTSVCSIRCYETLVRKYREEKCFRDDVYGMWVKKDEETPVAIIHFNCGNVSIVHTRLSALRNLVESKQVGLYSGIIENKIVPVYISGYIDPIRRVIHYLTDRYSETVCKAIDAIKQNKDTGVYSVYSQFNSISSLLTL